MIMIYSMIETVFQIHTAAKTIQSFPYPHPSLLRVVKEFMYNKMEKLSPKENFRFLAYKERILGNL